jgi:GNAT superfamily N-acetyltransferase
MLPWMQDAKRSITIRPARLEDAGAIEHLVQQNPRSYLHSDWRSPTEWIGRAPAFIAENRFGAMGCIITPIDPPPAAWIRLAGAAPGIPPAVVMHSLLEASLLALADQGASTLAAMPAVSWLPPILEKSNFAIVEHVVTWEKPDLHIPQWGSKEARVRPGQPEDIPRLTEIERTAFAPRWRLSAETISYAMRSTGYFSVAERQGIIVGFQISQISSDRAHLVRLTVHPAAQRSGVGSRLLATALRVYSELGLRSVTLNTQADNIPSHQLYRNFGFRPAGFDLPVWERPI